MTRADRFDPVYESASPRALARARAARAFALALALVGAALLPPRPVAAQGIETTIVDARDAFRRHDRVRLAALKAQAASERNPLAMWVDYWELTNRVNELQPAEFAAFAQRWSGTYVEDRMRNDWLLELVRRRDRAGFAAEYPRFRMNDDREVTCFALADDQLSGKDVREAAVAAWLAQKDADDGCAFLAATLADAKQLTAADMWKKVRVSIEANKPRAARQAAALISDAVARGDGRRDRQPGALSGPQGQRGDAQRRRAGHVALVRLAATDSDSAAALLADRWERALPAPLASYAWASVARQSAIKLQPEASDQFLRAGRVLGKSGREIELSDDTLAWKARAALRADDGRPRWQQVVQAINAMSAAEQKDAAWVYWKARGLQAAGARLAGRRGAAGEQPRPARGHRPAAELLRRPRRRRPRPAAVAARSRRRSPPPNAMRRRPTRASAGRCC